MFAIANFVGPKRLLPCRNLPDGSGQSSSFLLPPSFFLRLPSVTPPFFIQWHSMNLKILNHILHLTFPVICSHQSTYLTHEEAKSLYLITTSTLNRSHGSLDQKRPLLYASFHFPLA